MDEFPKTSFSPHGKSVFSNPKDSAPFDRFLKTPELQMLGAALPYVSEPTRKPLAIYIKSEEIKRILSDFDREEVLSACGFEPSLPDPEAMLKAMKAAGGSQAAPQIDQALQLLNMLKTYQRLNEMMQSNPEMMSFLSNMMQQSQNAAPAKPDTGSSSGSIDSSDMMSFLTQMLKNSR